MTEPGPVVVDAANLRVGGGVQVASAFIGDLQELVAEPDHLQCFPWLERLSVTASPEVRANLRDDALLAAPGPGRGPAPSVRFSVFGPRYGRTRQRTHVMGFADITLFGSPVRRPPARALRTRVRRPLAMRSFRRADLLVAETESTKQRLVDHGFAADRVVVVPNVPHPIFRSPPSARDVARAASLPVVYAARGYPHKNHEFLGRLGACYEAAHGERLTFWVTLSDDEWRSRSRLFKRYCENLGVLPVAALPSVYARAGMAIFPSLLESFSAAPLEALSAGVPLLAGDRDFVRAVCGDAAWYFDPTDPASAARAVAQARGRPEGMQRKVAAGRDLISAWPTSRDRSERYLELIDGAVRGHSSGAVARGET